MKSFFLFCFVLILRTGNAQDLGFARKIVDTLTSKTFWGRGYVMNGMEKAANYISNQFSSFSLRPLGGKNYFQQFSYPVNSFPGKMELSVNDRKLIPGRDFIVNPESSSAHGKGKLAQADSTSFIDSKNRFLIEIADKLTWSVAGEQADYCAVKVKRSSLSGLPEKYCVDIENEFQKKFIAANVCGYVPGEYVPDSFVFITAHYDHLGGMGSETYFPGANDNASGISLLLNLARWYAKHPQRYSIAFICFAGEEAGLQGSKFYTEHPLIELKKIRFLINTDLAGTGEDGITVVNATEFPVEFKKMQEINDRLGLLKAVNPRGKAANSDHYFFSEKGVPAFFFYTLGGIAAYHDIFDISATLPLDKHESLFRLVTEFVSAIQNDK